LDRPDWAPAGVDKPSAARVYDYSLGGTHNFAADRAIVEALNAAVPSFSLVPRTNRAFLHRAVRYLIDVGIRQFLDIGSGIPTRGNVHQIAQQAAPGARVVYVDIDPIAVAHSQTILAGNPTRWQFEELLARTPTPLTLRTRAQIAQMFSGLDLVAPGLVWVPQWYPDTPDDLDDDLDNHPERSGVLGGIGHKA
jgi:hypothetical protein